MNKLVKRGSLGRTGLDGHRGSGESKMQGSRLAESHFATLDALIAEGIATSRSGAVRWLIEQYEEKRNKR